MSAQNLQVLYYSKTTVTHDPPLYTSKKLRLRKDIIKAINNTLMTGLIKLLQKWPF